jgi:hypothetical protein
VFKLHILHKNNKSVEVHNKCSKSSRKSQSTVQHLCEEREVLFLPALIFTFLCAGSGIQNASDQFDSCIQVYLETFFHQPNPANKNLKELGQEILVAKERDHQTERAISW